jgi:hypothetical protein
MRRGAAVCVGVLVATIVVSSGSIAAATELGGNYNQYVCDISNGLVTKSRVRWVRAFVNIPRNFLAYDDPTDHNLVTGVQNLAQASDPVSGESEHLGIATATKLQQLKHTGARGVPVKVILNLKLDMKYRNDPSQPAAPVPEPGTQVFGWWVDAVEQFLTQHDLGASIDVLVLGNEPMYEVEDTSSAAASYRQFLGGMIDAVAGVRDPSQGRDFRIFVGALDKPSAAPTSPILNAVVDAVNGNELVDGLDLHLHEDALKDVKKDLDFIRKKKQVTKSLSVTEFSLVGLWNSKANDTLGSWGPAHGYSATMTTAAWIDALMTRASDGDPVPADELASFFASRKWYPKHWFDGFMTQFGAHDVELATYGLSAAPNVPGDGPQCSPSALLPLVNGQAPSGTFLWVLDFVYNGALLGQADDGFYVRNPIVAADFAKWLKSGAAGAGAVAAASDEDPNDVSTSGASTPSSISAPPATTTGRPPTSTVPTNAAPATTAPTTSTSAK